MTFSALFGLRIEATPMFGQPLSERCVFHRSLPIQPPPELLLMLSCALYRVEPGAYPRWVISGHSGQKVGTEAPVRRAAATSDARLIIARTHIPPAHGIQLVRLSRRLLHGRHRPPSWRRRDQATQNAVAATQRASS